MPISVKGHKITWDRCQFILHHPRNCKTVTCLGRVVTPTFFGYWVIEAELEACGIALPPQEDAKLQKAIQEHKRTKCGYLQS